MDTSDKQKLPTIPLRNILEGIFLCPKLAILLIMGYNMLYSNKPTEANRMLYLLYRLSPIERRVNTKLQPWTVGAYEQIFAEHGLSMPKRKFLESETQYRYRLQEYLLKI